MIDKNLALKLEFRDVIYVLGYYNLDGTPACFRVNGKIKTWKRDTERFELPIVHGLKDFNYLTNNNCHKFSLSMPEPISKKLVQKINSKFKW